MCACEQALRGRTRTVRVLRFKDPATQTPKPNLFFPLENTQNASPPTTRILVLFSFARSTPGFHRDPMALTRWKVLIEIVTGVPYCSLLSFLPLPSLLPGLGRFP